jgi:hypothetical protein
VATLVTVHVWQCYGYIKHSTSICLFVCGADTYRTHSKVLHFMQRRALRGGTKRGGEYVPLDIGTNFGSGDGPLTGRTRKGISPIQTFFAATWRTRFGEMVRESRSLQDIPSPIPHAHVCVPTSTQQDLVPFWFRIYGSTERYRHVVAKKNNWTSTGVDRMDFFAFLYFQAPRTCRPFVSPKRLGLVQLCGRNALLQSPRLVRRDVNCPNRLKKTWRKLRFIFIFYWRSLLMQFIALAMF